MVPDSKSDSLNTEAKMTAGVVWGVWFTFSIATGNFSFPGLHKEYNSSAVRILLVILKVVIKGDRQ